MLSSFKIAPINFNIEEAVKSNIDNKTKPIGSLGELENIALQVAMIQETEKLKINNPTLVVFAGDHGITKEGVSPYSQDVTWQMMMNFVSGGAAINVFAKQNGWKIELVDAGVNFDFDQTLPIRNLKVAYGTKNFLTHQAMTDEQLSEAITKASNLVKEIHNNGSNCIAFGEMGIGNTSSASLLMNKITGVKLEDCTGKGTGLDEEGLKRKIKILQQAIINNPTGSTESILQTFGGFEIVMMTAAILQAAELKMIILVDGFIVSSALLVAATIHPEVLYYCIFAHESNEKGHQYLLKYFKANPILRLGMRLGEGTGAALALPIVMAAVNFYNDMASFENAGVSNKID